MKKFIYKISIFALFFLSVNTILLFSIPKDENNYKVELLEKTPSPRIIFIGGSSIAFGTDSKMLKDSMHINVVNFGLHGGIGMKFPMDDCLDYVKKGDIIAIQMEYENFFNTADGELGSFCPFMVATNWRNADRLNIKQWYYTITGVPQVVYGNIRRLMKYPFIKTLNKTNDGKNFEYLKSGFNEYGDEISHLNYFYKPVKTTYKAENKVIDETFIEWLSNIILKYEQSGAKVIMLPPVCIRSVFDAVYVIYSNKICEALNKIHRPYIVNPSYMVLDDSCSFGGGYHVNREGVRQNTKHILDAIGKMGQ